MDKYLAKFFPGEPIDTYELEQEPPKMPYRIEYQEVHTERVKYYLDDTRKKAVWTTKECTTKVQKLIDSGKTHEEFWSGVLAWQAKSGIDELTTDWAADCFRKLEEIYTEMTSKKDTSIPSTPEAPMPPPPTKGLFTRPASSTKSPSGLFKLPTKPSLFAKKDS